MPVILNSRWFIYLSFGLSILFNISPFADFVGWESFAFRFEMKKKKIEKKKRNDKPVSGAPVATGNRRGVRFGGQFWYKSRSDSWRRFHVSLPSVCR